MAKFGTSKFGTFKFGTGVVSKFRANICINGIPLGFQVRRQVGKEWIFRVKQGTQEKYPYFVPANPQTPGQQSWRTTFTSGVAAALALTEGEKEVYRKDAYRKKGQTWFTRFMAQYLWSESH